MPREEQQPKALMKIDLLVSILCSAVSVMTLIGAWTVIPYRVEATEKRQSEAQIAHELRFKMLEQKQAEDHELAVRIDERLKSIQRALRIPTNE